MAGCAEPIPNNDPEYRPVNKYQVLFLQPNQTTVVGDGTRLAFEDQSFDLVYSNSVIEHLGTWEKQQAFAAEARRVGRGYWIPTPGQGVSG